MQTPKQSLRQIVKSMPVYFSVIIALLAGLLLYSCHSGKILSGFNKKNNPIDSLAIHQPVVFVHSLKDKKYSPDFSLRDTLLNVINTTTKATLSKKFKLQHPLLNADSIKASDWGALFKALDAAPKLSPFPVPPFLNSVAESAKCRYQLFICFQGYYNPQFSPYHNYQQNVRPGVSSMNLPVNQRNLFDSDMRVIILDYHSGNIIYYNKPKGKPSDPRVYAQVESQTTTVLKPVYYW
jgi:hypothetical protein